MDTPDKSNTITTPLSKIEDSPVFNYINSLSPIKPVSSVHTGQSFQLLSFPSPQSLHTSPGIGCSTKPKETYASHLSDTSAPQSSNGGNEGNGSGLISDLCQPADAHAKIVDCVRSGVEVDASDECPDAAIDPSRSLIGICCSPGSQGDKLKSKSNINITGMGTSAAEVIQGSTEDTGTKPANLAIFQHPNEKVVDTQNSESMHAVCSAQLDGRETKETFQTTIHTSTYSYEEVDRKSSIEDDNMQSTPQTQLIRRRCLIFEMSGSHYRKLVSDSDSSSIAGQPSSAAQPDEKPLRSSMPGSAKFSSPLPGIGLHLNALRVTGSDDIIVKHGPVPSKRQLIRTPSTVSSDSITESAPTETGSGEGQELNQGSPKKKRRRSENIGETESCKRCNCKRSKCLKLYCECFAAGLYCVEPCSCQGCFNQPAHEQTVMDTRKLIESRNPLAFAPKVIKFSDCQEIGEELNKTPASARHKSGCNCRKSSCLKKYCECFQGGVGCSLSCRCEGCRNSFGRKDGTEDFILEETGPAGEIATEANIKYEAPKFEDGKEQQDIQGKPYSEIDRSCTCFLPPCFGERSSECPSLAVPLSLQPCSSIKSDQANFLSYQPNLGSHLLMIPEDETPDTLNDVVSSHHTGVKSVSPNSKRVSPPYRESGASSTFRSVRKLILKSMSPFPVLTTPNKHDAGLQQG